MYKYYCLWKTIKCISNKIMNRMIKRQIIRMIVGLTELFIKNLLEGNAYGV